VIAGPFGINSLIIPDPVTGTSLCVPRAELQDHAGNHPDPDEKSQRRL
jgi:hypothetical protein